VEQTLEAEILAASQPLRVPGQGERRVLSPIAVERLSEGSGVARREVEAVALDAGIVPLHYLRNLARREPADQARLLRSTVAVYGDPVVIERLAELLGLQGVGKLLFCESGSWKPEAGTRIASRLKNRNANSELEGRTLNLRAAPGAALEGAEVVAACLASSAEEQLLQFACRMLKVPVVMAGVQEHRGQATTIFPGDAGVALVYKPRHQHLEPERPPVDPESKMALVVATWMAEQIVAVLIGEGELLKDRLHYADLETGEAAAYPL
jgi:hypothetical protein